MKVGHRSFPRHKTITKERILATAELVEVGLIDVRLGDFIEVGEGPTRGSCRFGKSVSDRRESSSVRRPRGTDRSQFQSPAIDRIN